MGLAALVSGQPWLFPSLGPTAFLMAEEPHHQAARAYNVIVGQMLGVGMGLLSVWLLRASQAPAVTASGHVTIVRVWAAVLATILTSAALIVLRAKHPPAASTTLIVALGGFRSSVHDVVSILIGVLFIAVMGECFRYLRLGQIPLWGDLLPENNPPEVKRAPRRGAQKDRPGRAPPAPRAGEKRPGRGGAHRPPGPAETSSLRRLFSRGGGPKDHEI
jgi:hypothetical protein